MKIISIFYLTFFVLIQSVSCQQKTNNKMVMQDKLDNQKVKSYEFLDCMYSDTYFPTFLVDKCKDILIQLCKRIETEKPDNLKKLYELTQNATNELNNLQDEFYDNNSEIETAARECLAEDFYFIAQAYNFTKVDIEMLIATRDW